MDTAATIAKFDAFRWAVIRLATYRPEKEKSESLIFGWVQILDVSRPHPASSFVSSHNVATGRGGRITIRNITLSVEAAINWYRSDLAQLNMPQMPESRLSADGDVPIRASDLVDDPAWPQLGVPIGSDVLFGHGGPGDPAPFVGSTSRGVRLHRRLGNAGESGELLQSDEIWSLLGRNLHVDLREYPEYLGALALTVPNPKIRIVRHYPIPNTEGDDEQTVYRLTPQPGQSLDDLKITILGRSSNILSTFEPIDVPADGIIVHSNSKSQVTGYVVSSEKDGVLAYQAPVPFIRSVRVSVGRSIPRPQSLANQSSAEVQSDGSKAMPPSGSSDRITPSGRVLAAEARRDRKAQALRYEQSWFDAGQEVAARSYLSSRIGRARDSVMLADPRFGRSELDALASSIHRLDVPLRILTSAEAFRPGSAARLKSYEVARSPSEVRRMRSLASALDKFQKDRGGNINVRVLENPLALMDRFLIVDTAAWLMGGSAADLGTGGSLMVQIPDGEPILEKLNELFYRAIPLEEYIGRPDAFDGKFE